MAKYVLSLDGGGVRGLATSVYLFELEKRLKKPLSSKFDLVVGTSTGGIIALVISVLEIEGPQTFRNLFRGKLKKNIFKILFKFLQNQIQRR